MLLPSGAGSGEGWAAVDLLLESKGLLNNGLNSKKKLHSLVILGDNDKMYKADRKCQYVLKLLDSIMSSTTISYLN